MSKTLSLNRIDEIMRAVFLQLKTMGGHANGEDVLAAVEPKLGLTTDEKMRTHAGTVRWDAYVRFYTSDCVKAGYLSQSEDQWILTPKGEQALALRPGELIRSADREYRKWAFREIDEHCRQAS